MENEWFLKEIEDIDNVISDDSDDGEISRKEKNFYVRFIVHFFIIIASVHVLPGPFYQGE